METRLKVEYLANFPSELKRMRQVCKFFNEWNDLQGREAFNLSNKLWQFWDGLQEWIPKLELAWLWEFQSFDQKIALVEWMTNNAESFSRLSNQRIADFRLPVDFDQDIQIWSESVNLYWKIFFSSLEAWSNHSNAHLEEIKLVTDLHEVELHMIWVGPFDFTKKLNVKEAEQIFWSISLHLEQTARLPKVSNALLLTTQVIAQFGGNMLIPIEVQDNRLTMKLKIPRADTGLSEVPSQTVSKNVLEQIINLIISQLLPGYIQASTHLERSLLEEINRFEPHVVKGNLERHWIDELRGVLDELVSIRETFVTYW
jgi:hypothetical protein